MCRKALAADPDDAELKMRYGVCRELHGDEKTFIANALGKRRRMVAEDIGFDGFDVPEVSSLLFHPRRCDRTDGLEPTTISVPGAALGGLWFEHRGSDDVVLFFHGNGEVAADWIEMASDYASAFGASVWLLDYRGYGRSSGLPSYSLMLSDSEVVFAALADREAKRGRPFRRRFVFGRSIGSAPAIHLAWRFRHNVDALVVDSGFSRLAELGRRLLSLRGRPGVVPAAPSGFLDNVDKLRFCRMPTLFLHGAVDKLIPVQEARENFKASAASRKWLVGIPCAGHNDLVFRGCIDNSYFGAIRTTIAVHTLLN